jgi:Ca2+-binding RTX toxin-like protein
MRRITLLLMVMASTLLVASGVAWAVTKTCPPFPQKCTGTNGADVLKSTSQKNDMFGGGGNDTYTGFVKGNSGFDTINDSGGKDTLVLTAYPESEVYVTAADFDHNGKADSVVIGLGPTIPSRDTVVIYDHFDNNRSLVNKRSTWTRGPGYIEQVLVKK